MSNFFEDRTISDKIAILYIGINGIFVSSNFKYFVQICTVSCFVRVVISSLPVLQERIEGGWQREVRCVAKFACG